MKVLSHEDGFAWRRTRNTSKCILRGLASGGISVPEKIHYVSVQTEELQTSGHQLETS